RSRTEVGLAGLPDTAVVEDLDDVELRTARHHADHADVVVHRIGGAGDVGAVAVAVFVPVLASDLRDAAGGDADEVVVTVIRAGTVDVVEESGIDDAELHPGAVRRAGIDVAVAIRIPDVAGLELVDVPGHDLGFKAVLGDGFDQGDCRIGRHRRRRGSG